jgi:cytochrome c553
MPAMPDPFPIPPHRLRVHAMVALLALLASGPLAAQELEVECLDCHRPGQARGDVPLIEGQHAGYLQQQLLRFRDRHRDEFPMSALAAGIDASAAERIADALAARSWRSAPQPPDAAAAARGRARSDALACDSCHAGHYLGEGDIPRLAGQQPGYLQRQLTAFADGERHHPPSGVGARMYVLDAGEVHDLAMHLHALGAAAGPAD